MYDKNFEKFQFLIKNSLQVKDLSELGFDLLSDKIDKEFVLLNFHETKALLKSGLSSQELIIIYNTNDNKRTFLTDNALDIEELSTHNISAYKLTEIYDKNPQIIELIINNTDTIIELLKNEQLKVEDLLDCTDPKQIQNLIDKRITPEAFKKQIEMQKIATEVTQNAKPFIIKSGEENTNHFSTHTTQKQTIIKI